MLQETPWWSRTGRRRAASPDEAASFLACGSGPVGRTCAKTGQSVQQSAPNPALDTKHTPWLQVCADVGPDCRGGGDEDRVGRVGRHGDRAPGGGGGIQDETDP